MSDRVRLSTNIPIQYLWDSRTLIKNDFRNISKSTEDQRGCITANSLLAEGSLSCDDNTTPHVATVANSISANDGGIIILRIAPQRILGRPKLPTEKSR